MCKMMITVAAVSLPQLVAGASLRVGTQVEVNVAMEGLRSSIPVFEADYYDSISADASGRAELSYSYPATPPAGAGYATSSTDAGAGASALAKLDLSAGKLHLHDSAWIFSGKDSSTYGWVHGYATVSVTDIIHLEQPTTVTLVGEVSGYLFGLQNGEAYTNAGMGASFEFYQWAGGEIGYDSVGYDKNFRPTFVDTTNAFYLPGMQPQPTTVKDPVRYTWDLPAGDHYFKATLDAGLSLMVDPDGSARCDMGFENTATFRLLVPEAALAGTTSQLGVPIAVPEPTSLGLAGTAVALLLRRRR